MNSTSNPIGFFDKLNASVLLAVTPEYSKIKAAEAKVRAVFHPVPNPQL